VLGEKGYLGEENIRSPGGMGKPTVQKKANRRMAGFAPLVNGQLKTLHILRGLRRWPHCP
jgi:hypothetical protein